MIELVSYYSNYIGMAGVSLILSAYYLLNTHKTSARSVRYQLMNFIGSWLILFSLFFHWNLSSVLIEIAWIIISSIGFYRAYYQKHEEQKA